MLYQRNATNEPLLNAIGFDGHQYRAQLTANQTQLDVNSQVTAGNQNDFYTFNFQGGSPMKVASDNLSRHRPRLRFQLYGQQRQHRCRQSRHRGAANGLRPIDDLSAGFTSDRRPIYRARHLCADRDQGAGAELQSAALFRQQFSSSYQTTAAPQTSAEQPAVTGRQYANLRDIGCAAVFAPGLQHDRRNGCVRRQYRLAGRGQNAPRCSKSADDGGFIRRISIHAAAGQQHQIGFQQHNRRERHIRRACATFRCQRHTCIG